MPLDFQKLGVANSPGAVLADRLEGAHDCEILAVKMAGLGRAAINEDCGNIQARDGEHAAGHIFVAAADHHHAVHARCAANRLDRISDHFARNEREFHPLGAHRNSVAHRDGAENLRHGLGIAENAHGALREIIQARVARRHGAVAIGNADDGLVEIVVAEANGAQHRAIRRALHSVGDQLASFIHTHLECAF